MVPMLIGLGIESLSISAWIAAECEVCCAEHDAQGGERSGGNGIVRIGQHNYL